MAKNYFNSKANMNTTFENFFVNLIDFFNVKYLILISSNFFTRFVAVKIWLVRPQCEASHCPPKSYVNVWMLWTGTFVKLDFSLKIRKVFNLICRAGPIINGSAGINTGSPKLRNLSKILDTQGETLITNSRYNNCEM